MRRDRRSGDNDCRVSSESTNIAIKPPFVSSSHTNAASSSRLTQDESLEFLVKYTKKRSHSEMPSSNILARREAPGGISQSSYQTSIRAERRSIANRSIHSRSFFEWERKTLGFIQRLRFSRIDQQYLVFRLFAPELSWIMLRVALSLRVRIFDFGRHIISIKIHHLSGPPLGYFIQTSLPGPNARAPVAEQALGHLGQKTFRVSNARQRRSPPILIYCR